MNKSNAIFILFITFPLNNCIAQNIRTNKELQLVASIQLPNVSGRIDHLSFDSKNKTLYVAALGNNTVEVVDLKSQKVIHSIKGLHKPQGIKYIIEYNVIFVANGENGECDIFNADSYELISSVKLPGDADNVRYDSSAGKIFAGYGNGGISIIDAKTFKQLADIKLPGHPESFQVDPGSNTIFVNVPDAQAIFAIDTDKKSITAMWEIENTTENFPMALDSKHHRLFIGCRNPAKLLVLNSDNGKTVTQLDIDSDTDDVFYDSSANQIYISCGGGYIDIVSQTDEDNYIMLRRIESRPGARTSLFVPETDQLIVAAPARSGSDAQLMIYEKK